jgi:4-amino-4-deoxy-L-arabinose transferase-like glycosyltransferase
MPSNTQKTNIIDLLIPLFALGLITFGIGSYGLYEPHESHFAMVGNEMVLREDWITPYLNGAPYLNKPPLLYWLIAISTTIFGNHEFAARLPIALAGWLGIMIAGKWSQDLWGVTAYRITILMLSVTLGWFIFSHQILTDILLATLLLASNYFLWKLLHEPRSQIYFLCLYTCITLCLLTKGLVGIFFISCSYLAIAIYHRSWRILSQSRLPLGILLITVLILPWAIAIEQANPGFWHYFIVNEHFARILDRRFPPDYVVSRINFLGYLGVTALWCLPWILFLPSVISFTWQKLKFKANQRKTSQQNALLLLSVNFIVPILVFLPLSSRLIYYSIPAIPVYTILCAGTLNNQLYFSKKNLYSKLWRLKINLDRGFSFYGFLLTIIGITAINAVVFFPKLFPSFTIIQKYSIVTSLVAATLLVLALGSLLSGIELLKRNYTLSFKSLIISLFLIYTIITIVFSFYQDIRSSKNLVSIVNNHLPLSTLWVFEGSREIGAAAGLTYYLNQEKEIELTAESLLNKQAVPVGIVLGKDQKVYRHVLVLEDSGNNRIPPQFPGKKPNYLIDQQQLQTYWDSARPVIFITDFLRDFHNPQDPINLNLPNNTSQSFLQIGKRQVYLNQAAIKSVNSLRQFDN